MVDGLAKSAESPSQVSTSVSVIDANIPVSFDGVPLELYRHFSLGVQVAPDDKRMLDDLVSMWDKKTSLGDFLLSLKSVEVRNSLTHRQDKLSSVWRHLRLTKQIAELEKQRASI